MKSKDYGLLLLILLIVLSFFRCTEPVEPQLHGYTWKVKPDTSLMTATSEMITKPLRTDAPVVVLPITEDFWCVDPLNPDVQFTHVDLESGDVVEWWWRGELLKRETI